MTVVKRPNDEMLNSIILSIKPKYCKLILRREKVFEFRNFKPKKFSLYFWVYESNPTKQIKYLMKIKEPVVFPDKLGGDGYGNHRFNSGEMKAKYAYEIEELYSIEKPLDMIILKEAYRFTPPQSYTYLQNNVELFSYIRGNCKLIKLI